MKVGVSFWIFMLLSVALITTLVIAAIRIRRRQKRQKQGLSSQIIITVRRG